MFENICTVKNEAGRSLYAVTIYRRGIGRSMAGIGGMLIIHRSETEEQRTYGKYEGVLYFGRMMIHISGNRGLRWTSKFGVRGGKDGTTQEGRRI
jgi:hypothetical protein